MSIKSYKLVSGEEIVAEVAGSKFNGTTEVLILKQPFTLQFQADPRTGRSGLALMPWFMSAPEAEQVELPLTTIAAGPVAPLEVIVQQYRQQTSSIDLSAAAPQSIIA